MSWRWPWQDLRDDVWHGLERCLDGGYPALLKIFLGLALGWWLYVPVHELLHALGCLAAGGEVTRLEIGRLYGGELWARLVPWVVPGSEYAGRLSGFDTHGDDLTYLVTDLAPFVLTLFPGVWLLRRAGQRRQPFFWGLALPMALAPFLSLTGDAYEIGSILTTQLWPWSSPELRELLRGDDLFKVAGEVAACSERPWGGLGLGATIGLVWALSTYTLGSWVAHWSPSPSSSPSAPPG